MTVSPFEELDLQVCVSLLPSDIGDIYAGIRRHVYRYLMKYHEAVGGVLLAVSKVSFADGGREGRITDEMPHIHFDVKAKAQVFRPRAGHVLEGRVNKVTSTHVGMLVCGIFNASIAAEEMGEGFMYDVGGMEWRGPNGQVLALGNDAEFVVKRMHEAAGLISIEGSLEGVPTTATGKLPTAVASPQVAPKTVSVSSKSSSKPPKKKKAKRDSTSKAASVKAEL